MKKIAALIVKGRYILLIAAVVLSIVCALVSLKVDINTDLTTYLPDNFSMKHKALTKQKKQSCSINSKASKTSAA